MAIYPNKCIFEMLIIFSVIAAIIFTVLSISTLGCILYACELYSHWTFYCLLLAELCVLFVLLTSIILILHNKTKLLNRREHQLYGPSKPLPRKRFGKNMPLCTRIIRKAKSPPIRCTTIKLSHPSNDHRLKMEKEQQFNSAELLMRSIRGIPYLIQAIQYSMETNQMNELTCNNSVIHTAPGCKFSGKGECNRFDCAAEPSEHILESQIGQAVNLLEETIEDGDWQEETKRPFIWTNRNLRITMNRANSSLAVFPYAEGTPLTKNHSNRGSLRIDGQQLPISIENLVSRVNIQKTKLPNSKEDIRLISMSNNLLNRFSNSFRN